MIGLYCTHCNTHHSIYLNIGFLYNSFVYKSCVLIKKRWSSFLVVITTAQLQWGKPELRFWAASNPPRDVLGIQDNEDLWQWSRLKIRLNAFRRSTIPQEHFFIVIIIIINFWKSFLFSRKFLWKLKYWKIFFLICHIKTWQSLRRRANLKVPAHCF